MAAAAAQMVGQQALNMARQGKWASRGLSHLSGKTKNRFLKGLLGGGSKVAAALGFGRAMGDQAKGGRRRAPPPPTGRVRFPTVTSGGNTAGAANAPVAFGRTQQLRPLFRAYPSQSGDGMIVHSVDFLGQVGPFNATAGTFQSNLLGQISPAASGTFNWLSGMADLFGRYKMKLFRLHYEHYCATSIQGQIVLQYWPDANFNGGVMTGVTQQVSQECSNYMTGAVYEDFSHTADLSGLDKGQWYNTETTLGADSPNENYAGLFSVFTTNGVGAQVSTGNIWVEGVFEFHERKTSTVTSGVAELKQILRTMRLPFPVRRQLAERWLSALLDVLQERERRAKEDRGDQAAIKLLERYGMDVGAVFGTAPAASTPLSRWPALKNQAV